MKRCNHCNLEFNTDRFTCPFCKKTLVEAEEKSKIDTIYTDYPKFKDKIHKINLVQRIFVFISLIAAAIIIITNYYEYKNNHNSLWSVIVLMGIGVLWSLIRGVIISKKNPSKRVFNFSLCLILLFLSIEYCSITNKGNYSNWSISYVIPFILIATLSTINLMIFIKIKKYPDFVGYQFWISMLLVLYYLLYIFNIVNVLWPSLVCLTYGASTIVAMFFFGGRATKEEIKKRLTL